MTQEAKVLSYIQENGNITPWEAIERFHITRLAAVVCRLRREGHDIITVMHSKTQDGETVRWAEYIYKEPFPVGRETALAGDEAPASP